MGFFSKRNSVQAPVVDTKAERQRKCAHAHYYAERVSSDRMEGHCKDCGKFLVWRVRRY